ncbi:MAG TPA: hypothetical protein VFS27_05295 [Blastocatellia bacterium]|jgi:hypothetical protein|nr:hypothetical protein [Blastocatellia bacterium]
MPKLSSPLDNLKIAAPCPADWDRMFSFEDGRVRFCSQCNLNVYNLSGMSKQEAEALITKTEGRLCVRFYRRPDGSVLTQNCPVGLKKIRRRVAWVAQVVAGMALSFVSGFGLYISYVGRKPDLPVLEPDTLTVGLAPPKEIPPPPPEIGEVSIAPRKNSRASQGEVIR